MEWTPEDRLKIIKALIVLEAENETWELFKVRLMFLCNMPAEFLEINRDKYARAIELAKADMTIEI